MNSDRWLDRVSYEVTERTWCVLELKFQAESVAEDFGPLVLARYASLFDEDGEEHELDTQTGEVFSFEAGSGRLDESTWEVVGD